MFYLQVSEDRMKKLLKIFLGDTHPYYHAVVLGVAIYAAWKIHKVEEVVNELEEAVNYVI